ncbi:hypothetical protein SY85_20945 [Flavisolibacter tropicus]|uniref:LTD domain-containing protein n=2 Tax=Flavisolibacter tropicus TaxID=1492898 RepID=A0A172TZT9_9BACT|nr:hypothetical protein SY85_20945 [Flavisolibacter tropicus]
MNFGPGPMNIGCYIVTNGIYSVTIPPNTVIQPGEYYVIAGSNTLLKDCGNVDSAVQVQLNWNTCNCTNIPIPTSGPGFFEDGGGGNEKIVLFKPNLEIVDAVSRWNPVSLSNNITTSSIGGQCASYTFDLDNMSIPYEIMGMSTGQGNSYARTIDGDCLWVKDPPQSAHATNNRAGDVSAINYALNITGAQDCGSGGSLSVQVNIVDTKVVTDYSVLFPMNYSIAFDANNDGIFDLTNDQYSYGEDNTPPSIDITGLPMGRYRFVVGSKMGCFLATFNVNVLFCGGVLNTQILNFDLVKQTNSYYTFRWMLAETGLAKTMIVEKSADGRHFTNAAVVPLSFSNTSSYWQNFLKEPGINFYRLRVVSKNGTEIYSPVVNTGTVSLTESAIGPNPATDILKIKLTGTHTETVHYKLYNALSEQVGSGQYLIHSGTNVKQLTVSHLPSGLYQLVILKKNSTEQPISFRFVKP